MGAIAQTIPQKPKPWELSLKANPQRSKPWELSRKTNPQRPKPWELSLKTNPRRPKPWELSSTQKSPRSWVTSTKHYTWSAQNQIHVCVIWNMFAFDQPIEQTINMKMHQSMINRCVNPSSNEACDQPMDQLTSNQVKTIQTNQ